MNDGQLRALGRKIKLIVFDLDDTLLLADKTISQYTLDTLREARARGIVATIGTGRLYSNARLQAELTESDSSPVIAANGAHIYDFASEKTLWRNVNPSESFLPIIEHCLENGLDGCIYGEDSCWFASYSRRIESFHGYNAQAHAAGSREIPLYFYKDDPSDALNQTVYKLLVYEPDKEKYARMWDWMADKTEFGVTSSGNDLIDVMARGVCKGEGVRQLARLLGLGTDEVCAFGDYENDITMFEAAGLSFAMCNGSEAARQAAAAVTKRPNTEDGAARAVREYILGMPL